MDENHQEKERIIYKLRDLNVETVNKKVKEPLPPFYRIYVLKRGRKKKSSKIVYETRTHTFSPKVASLAFMELRCDPRFEDGRYVLLMTRDSIKINIHRFDVPPDDEAYFDLKQAIYT